MSTIILLIILVLTSDAQGDNVTTTSDYLTTANNYTSDAHGYSPGDNVTTTSDYPTNNHTPDHSSNIGITQPLIGNASVTLLDNGDIDITLDNERTLHMDVETQDVIYDRLSRCSFHLCTETEGTMRTERCPYMEWAKCWEFCYDDSRLLISLHDKMRDIVVKTTADYRLILTAIAMTRGPQ